MNDTQAPSFSKGGAPLFTIKYPPPPTPLQKCCPHDLTNPPKTVSFKGQIPHTYRRGMNNQTKDGLIYFIVCYIFGWIYGKLYQSHPNRREED